MHTGLLRVDGLKMGKSAGNFMTIREALGRADFRTLRYAFLSQHYRSSMELNAVTIENARNARRRVENFARSVDRSHPETAASAALAEQARKRVFERLDDDLDTPGALAAFFEFIRDQNRSGEAPGRTAAALLGDLDDLFDAFDIGNRPVDDATVEAELARRRQLRRDRKFQEADAIRDGLHERGIVIEDTSDGTRWWVEEGVSGPSRVGISSGRSRS
jgi:cysteinyl-tRNA synthetase